MLKFYLDSSAILKRYVTEPGTQTIDLIFDQAENGQLIVAFSLWNIWHSEFLMNGAEEDGLVKENSLKL